MGNPAGRPKKVKNDNVNLDELVKKITEEVTVKLEKKYEQKIKEGNKINVSGKKNKNYKYISDETKVRVQSNVNGTFVFQEDKGIVRVFLQLDGYGDTAVISYAELRAIYAIKPNIIRKCKIAIVDVYSDEDITLEDILMDLRLDKIYLDKDMIDPQNIDCIFSEEVDSKEFEKLIDKSSMMSEVILESAYVLFKNGQFTDNSKINYLKQKFRKKYLFQ